MRSARGDMQSVEHARNDAATSPPAACTRPVGVALVPLYVEEIHRGACHGQTQRGHAVSAWLNMPAPGATDLDIAPSPDGPATLPSPPHFADNAAT